MNAEIVVDTIASEPATTVPEINNVVDVPNTAVAERVDPPRVSILETPTTLSPKEVLFRSELDASYNARQCIIDRESRSSGMYHAEFGGSASGNDGSTASGAYQWLNSSWRNYLPWAEYYYGLVLTSPEETNKGARNHAAYAEPFVQDLVASFALLHRDRAQNQRPWPYSACWNMVGSSKRIRPDGPENGPTGYVRSQLG